MVLALYGWGSFPLTIFFPSLKDTSSWLVDLMCFIIFHISHFGSSMWIKTITSFASFVVFITSHSVSRIWKLIYFLHKFKFNFWLAATFVGHNRLPTIAFTCKQKNYAQGISSIDVWHPYFTTQWDGIDFLH